MFRRMREYNSVSSVEFALIVRQTFERDPFVRIDFSEIRKFCRKIVLPVVIVNVDVCVNLPRIILVTFFQFRKIIVDGIEQQSIRLTPVNRFLQQLPLSHRIQDELVTTISPHFQVIDQVIIRTPDFRPEILT